MIEDHPGIVKRQGPAGRRPGIAGGMDVWELIAIVKDQPGEGERAIEQAADYLDVSPIVVRAAVNFYEQNRAETDEWIERNREESEVAETAWRASLDASPPS